MSAHHDNDHHVTESKPVSFRTPLIFGLVVVFLILLLVSTCDGGHHKGKCECKEECSEECMKKCEEGDHSGHDMHATEHATATEHEVAKTEEVVAVVDSVATADSLVKTVPVTEEKAHH